MKEYRYSIKREKGEEENIRHGKLKMPDDLMDERSDEMWYYCGDFGVRSRSSGA